VNLTKSCVAGNFRSSGGSTVITSVTIPSGSSTASFRYRGTAAGSVTITASASGYASASQTEQVDTAPTISGVATSYTMTRSTVRNVTVTVGDADSGASVVTLTATSSNQNVIYTTGVTFSGSGSSRTMRIAPRAGRTGTSTITITASDGLLTTTRTFTLHVS